MMLGEPGDRIAELVGEPGLLGDLAKHLRRRFLRLARAHQIKDPEFHDPALRSTRSPPRWRLSGTSVKTALSFGAACPSCILRGVLAPTLPRLQRGPLPAPQAGEGFSAAVPGSAPSPACGGGLGWGLPPLRSALGLGALEGLDDGG